MRVLIPTALLLASVSLGACSTVWKPPEISYDDTPRKAVISEVIRLRQGITDRS